MFFAVVCEVLLNLFLFVLGFRYGRKELSYKRVMCFLIAWAIVSFIVRGVLDV